MRKNDVVNRFRLAIVFPATIIAGTYREGLSALFPLLREEFDLSRFQLGLHSSFFQITATILALYSGNIIDKRGSKWGMIRGVLIMGMLFILHSMIPNMMVLFFLASLMGVGFSFIMPATYRGIVFFFPPPIQSTAIGMNSSCLPIGGALAAFLLPLVASTMGWRRAIILPGIFALLWVLMVFFYFPGQEQERDKESYERAEQRSEKIKITDLLKRERLLFLCLAGFSLSFFASSFVAHYMLFLKLDLCYPFAVAGLGFGVFQMGSILGRPGWGLFCERVFDGSRGKVFF